MFSVATVREKQKYFKVREKSENSVKGQGKSLKFVEVSEKSGNYIFVRKLSRKIIDFSDICRNSSFDQWFSVVFIIHLANLGSVKIGQKSVKSQEIF